MKLTKGAPCFLKTESGEIQFDFSRSRRRRTISIMIEENARVKIAAPYYASEEEILGFVREKFDWIVRRSRQAQKRYDSLGPRTFSDGEEYWFLGQQYPMRVIASDMKRVKCAFDGREWMVQVPRSCGVEDIRRETRRVMVNWYKDQAKEILGGRLFHYSRIVGVEPHTIAVRTQKRIWGNCDHRHKVIHLNWHIVMAPMTVVDYVVVHELCHLLVPNHSRRFWTKVESFLPDYRNAILWLKQHALALHLPDIK